MAINFEAIRRDYALRELSQEAIPKNPTDLFALWMKEAVESNCQEATAMHISTVDGQGRPSGRVVLLKGVSEEGFTFYTNYSSRKGKCIQENPYIAATFFWPELERQLRIEGTVRLLSREISEAYFRSRPFLSQISALVSPQSQKISSREVLENRFKEAQDEFRDRPIPFPENWGGYLIQPNAFEFWQGRPNRLHDRILYERSEMGQWDIARLAP